MLSFFWGYKFKINYLNPYWRKGAGTVTYLKFNKNSTNFLVMKLFLLQKLCFDLLLIKLVIALSIKVAIASKSIFHKYTFYQKCIKQKQAYWFTDKKKYPKYFKVLFRPFSAVKCIQSTQTYLCVCLHLSRFKKQTY